jgi:hypothetical protein
VRRIQPAPWRAEFLQYSQSGKRSRPRIVDATGKPVKLSNARQATLAALAPELLDALAGLFDRAEMLHLQLQSALGFNTEKPAELRKAEAVLRKATNA